MLRNMFRTTNVGSDFPDKSCSIKINSKFNRIPNSNFNQNHANLRLTYERTNFPIFKTYKLHESFNRYCSSAHIKHSIIVFIDSSIFKNECN